MCGSPSLSIWGRNTRELDSAEAMETRDGQATQRMGPDRPAQGQCWPDTATWLNLQGALCGCCDGPASGPQERTVPSSTGQWAACPSGGHRAMPLLAPFRAHGKDRAPRRCVSFPRDPASARGLNRLWVTAASQHWGAGPTGVSWALGVLGSQELPGRRGPARADRRYSLITARFPFSSHSGHLLFWIKILD